MSSRPAPTASTSRETEPQAPAGVTLIVEYVEDDRADDAAGAALLTILSASPSFRARVAHLAAGESDKPETNSELASIGEVMTAEGHGLHAVVQQAGETIIRTDELDSAAPDIMTC